MATKDVNESWERLETFFLDLKIWISQKWEFDSSSVLGTCECGRCSGCMSRDEGVKRGPES